MKLLPSSSGAFWACFSLCIAPLLFAQPKGAVSELITIEAAKHSRSEDFAKPAVSVIDRRTPLAFLLPSGDEVYNIVVDIGPRHRERPSCSPDVLTHITVNDQALLPARIGRTQVDIDPSDVQLLGSVQVHDIKSGTPRSINVILNPKCYHAKAGEEQNEILAEPHYKPHSWSATTPVLGIDLFLILDVDGEPWTENTFNVSSHLPNGYVVTTQVVSPNSPESQEDNPVDYPNPKNGDVAFDLDAFEIEIHKLSRLRHHLEASKAALKKQEQLVNSLLRNAHQGLLQELKACGISDIPCIFKTLFKRGKDCLDMFLLQFKEQAFGSQPEDPCLRMSDRTGPGSAKVLGLLSEKCYSKVKASSSYPHYQGYQALAGSDFDADIDYDPDTDFNGSPHVLDNIRPHSKTHKIHTVLGIVASALCLTCVFTLLHRRCCSPQARAARAARREERRLRRQHRCATRRQALREWWTSQQDRMRRRNRCDERRIQDYEEKRALILEQETVLENAMQEEIRKLRRQAREARGAAVDDVLAMVEEGRAGSSTRSSSSERQILLDRPPSVTETLPPYRSRASSGRPPSYNEFDRYRRGSDSGSEAFPSYASSSYYRANDESTLVDGESRSFRSSSSPASSVVSLSPRHSSETLRTERSTF